MDQWTTKLLRIESVIDEKASNHGKMDVRKQIPLMAKNIGQAQLATMLQLVLVNPSLGKLFADPESRCNNVFDVIGENIITQLTAHGEAYYESTYASELI